MASKKNKHLSNRDFLTAPGSSPEMQNAQANAKDNAAELASEALGSVNKQLYDFVAQALKVSLDNIMGSGTVEFEKLSQEVYRSVPEIIEGKMKDGDIADAMIENLNIYNGEVKPATSTGSSATTTTTKPETVEKTEEKKGETKEIEGKTTEVESPAIDIEQKPIEVEALHETIIQEQTHIQPTKEIVTQEQPRVERQIEEKTIIERPEDEHPELPAGFFMDEKEVANLKTKLKLLFIYLRSQKVDIFKIMAGVDENLINLKDKREEINLDYEEELRYRQNLRKEFNRQVALESAWYEQAFGALEGDEGKQEGKSQEATPTEGPQPRTEQVKAEEKPQEEKAEGPTIPTPEVTKVESATTSSSGIESPVGKSKKIKKLGLLKRILGKVLSPLKLPGMDSSDKRFIFVVVPLGDDVDVKQKKGMSGLFSRNPLEQREKTIDEELPKPPPIKERVKTALQTAKQNIRNAPKNLFRKAREAVKKKVDLFKFKRDKKTEYFKYTTVLRVKNKKSIKLWGKEMKWKRGTKKIAKDLGVQGDIPDDHEDAIKVKGPIPEDEDKLTTEELTPPKVAKTGFFDKLKSKLSNKKQPMPKAEDGKLPEEGQKPKTPVQSTKAVIGRFIRRRVVKTRAAIRRTWRRVSGSVKRGWGRFKKRARVTGRMLGRRLKRWGSKAWGGIKKVGGKVWSGMKKAGRAVGRVIARVGSAVWGVTKKVVSSAYNATTKATVAVTQGIGKGLMNAGKAAAKIPYAGVVLGPILMGLGIGISAMSKALRVAFKAAGRAAKAASRMVERAFRSFMKTISKLKGKGKGKGAMGQLSGIGDVLKKFSFKGFFTQIGRAIKGWTSKWIINGFAKKAMSGIDSLRKKGLKLKEPRLKLKPKWGSSKIKKESSAFLGNIYGKSVNAIKGALNTSFGWISSIMHTMGDGMTKMLSTLGERISTIGTVGIKGFLKALFSPKILIPIGLALLFFFRKEVFGWLKSIGEITFKGIFAAIKTIGSAIWKIVKTIGSGIATIGGWLWEQADASKRWTLAWVMKWGYKLAIGFILQVKRAFLSLVPTGNGSAFMLGMALGGYPWPLYGAMIYGAVKAGVLNAWKFIKRLARTYLGVSLWWMPTKPIDLFGRLMKLLGLGDVDPLWKKTALTLDEALTRHEENEEKVKKLVVNMSAANNINPVLNAIGFPDLARFNKAVGNRLKSSNDISEKYSSFIQQAADVLTDKKKAPGISPAFYASPKITEALLSVFFFRDPLTGQITSIIPKQNIPNIVSRIQKVILDAVEKNDAGALAQANTDVLNYFAYMNRGRGNVIANIADNYEKFINRLSTEDGDEQRKLAIDFGVKLQRGDFTAMALGDLALDMAVKTGEATTADTRQTQIEGSTKGMKGSVRSVGATSIIKATTSGGSSLGKGKNIKQQGGMGRLKDFIITDKELGKPNIGVGNRSEEEILNKRKAWKKYQEERNALIDAGKSHTELVAAGYGMNWNEWSEQYEKNKKKEIQRGDKSFVPKEKPSTNVVKLKGPAIPKIVLPQVQFKQPSKQVKISLPGLTRDVTEGTKQFKLLDMSIKQTGSMKSAKVEAKRSAWKKYQEERNALIDAGKSGAELKALGYGMNWNEWSAKYEADEKEKEQAEESRKKQSEAQAEKTEKQDEARVQEEAKNADKVKPPKEPGHFDKLISQMNKLHRDVKFALTGLTTTSILPDLSIIRGNGKMEPLVDKKEKKRSSFRDWLNTLKGKAVNVKDLIGLKKDGDVRTKEKIKSVADMMAQPPKKEDLALRESAKEQEAMYQSAGISLVSEAQWVSAQDAHKLEERIINNAKNVRDIIEGLRVMGKNLDNAKLDLGTALEEIKKNPIRQVVNLPVTTIPSPLQINIPGDQPEYDPLPPL